jgi:hypothetical protein
MQSYLMKCSDSDNFNRSKCLGHPPAKGFNFAFPEAASSNIGLKQEVASVVLTDSTGTVALSQSPDMRTSETPPAPPRMGSTLRPGPANPLPQDSCFRHL